MTLALAVRTTLEAMGFPLVDPHGSLAANTLVADASAGLTGSGESAHNAASVAAPNSPRGTGS